jgi:dienelactone hydrolase
MADIEFDAEGVTLRGLFFPAAGATRPAPCVVMAHGWAGEITHFIADFARIFSTAGIAAVVFDHRGWGRSDVAAGKTRHESEPWEQIRDYQHAITYAQNRQDVDPDRIGAWGSSYSAGHAFVVAAIDRRVKAVVGQVPVVSGLREFQGMVRVDMEDHNHEAFAADRRARGRGEAPMVIAVVAKDPLAMSALPMAEAYEYFYGPDGVIERDPSFRNEITLRSVEYLYGYEPGFYLPRISPTPLLMVVAPHDRVAPGELSLQAYESAAHPKKLVTIPGGHFDAYRGHGANIAQTAARDWFVEHLTKASTHSPSPSTPSP